VQARAGRACTPSVAAVVHERTGGIPLLVEELTRALVDAGALDADAAAIEQLDVPTRVLDLVAQRLPGLGEAATAVLEAAAVVGRELDWEVLPVMTGRDEDEVVDALDRAVASGLLVEVRGTAGRYAFAHDLVRQALHDRLGAARRGALHRRAASALAVLPTAGAADVAHHLIRGATAATAQDAAMAALVAAEDAVARVAHEEAARWYGEALAVLGASASAQQRAVLLLGRGEALASSGEREAAVTTLREAAAAAREAGDPVALARVSLALSGPSMGLWIAYGSDDRELVGMFDEVAGSLGAEHDALRARVLACRATCRSVADPDAAARDAALALALAESTGDTLALRSALFGTHMTSRRPGAARDRLAITDRLLGLADETDHPTDVLDALQLRLADLTVLGDLHAADVVIDRIETIGSRTRSVIAGWNVLRYRAMRAALAGRFDEATELASAGLQAGRLVQPANAFGSYAGLVSMVRTLQGAVEGMTDAVEAFAADNPHMPLYRANVAYSAANEGLLDRAAVALREVLDAGVPVDNNWLVANTTLAVACHRVRDAEAARELYTALAPCAGLHAAGGSWVSSFGPVDRALALLAELLGDDDAVDRHAAAAEAWCRQVGAWVYLALVRFDHARRLAARGSAAAAPALAEARATAEDAGVGLVLREIERTGER
jgi:tetratricopeptide (TPR) repeat protein